MPNLQMYSEGMTAQVRNIREAAAAEVTKGDKDDDGEVNKGDSK